MNKPGDYHKLSSREIDAAVHRRVLGQETRKLAAASADGGKSFACVENPTPTCSTAAYSANTSRLSAKSTPNTNSSNTSTARDIRRA